MTTSGRRHATLHPGPVPGTDVEVVRWTGRATQGVCTVTWLPTDRLDVEMAGSEVTEVERRRAAGFTRGNDRLLSLGSAWLMRRLVAIALDVGPLEAPIVRRCDQCARPHGRPLVRAATRDGATVHVSATHSGALVGVALSTAGPVGLDAEDLQARGPAAWSTVWRVLGHPVVPGGAVRGPEADREAATAWVRTEALLKATGQGLTVSPRSVEISPGEEPAVIRWPWGDPAGRVSIVDLSTGPRYVAALAALHDGLTGGEVAAAKKPIRSSRELI